MGDRQVGDDVVECPTIGRRLWKVGRDFLNQLLEGRLGFGSQIDNTGKLIKFVEIEAERVDPGKKLSEISIKILVWIYTWEKGIINRNMGGHSLRGGGIIFIPECGDKWFNLGNVYIYGSFK